jgi:hypothetical protein
MCTTVQYISNRIRQLTDNMYHVGGDPTHAQRMPRTYTEKSRRSG